MPAWIISIVTHIGFKVTSIILAVSLVSLALFSWIKIHDGKVRAKALTECPPQSVFTGNPIVNNFPIKKMGCFPIRIGNWGFGFCHD